MPKERETFDVDVLIAGAGPAGLSCALRLAQLQKGEAEKKEELTIALIEKGKEIGFHQLSGAVLDPRALRELLPEFEKESPPFESPVTTENVYYFTKNKALRFPIIPPPMRNHGNFVMALSRFTPWLSAIVEREGVNIFTRFPGAEMLYEGEKIVGIRTGDKGIDKEGKQKPNYEPGADIKAKVTILAEGVRGSLTKQLVVKHGLAQDKNPQIYATGVKEVWKVKPGAFPEGGVVHTMGYPLDSTTFGGSFIYGMKENLLSVGLVVSLDYHNPMTDPHNLFQRFKQHPFIQKILEGGEMVQYGAKAIAEGGYFAVPQMVLDGCLLIGECAGIVNVPRLKGIHLAMKSGMLAADTVWKALKENDVSAKSLSRYEEAYKTSWAGQEMYRSRNFRAAFHKNLWSGIIDVGIQQITGGRGLVARRYMEAGHKRMKPIKEFYPGGAPQEVLKPAYDGKLTFDKLTDVYYAGTIHEENQPAHLHVLDTKICVEKCTSEFGNPCQKFCPASVYEWVVDEATKERRFQINFTNCVHCKTCDIMDPYQIINWVTPEGGGGPVYKIL